MTHSRQAPIVTYAAAARLVAEAVRHAEAKGWTVAVVVLDPSGHIVAAARMDGVAPMILDYAADKAFTACLGKPTTAFFERMSSSPALAMGAANRPRLCAWDGGLPIREKGALIGAIGVSGAAGSEDVECAEAALAALGLTS